jgi:hypothetical protein
LLQIRGLICQPTQEMFWEFNMLVGKNRLKKNMWKAKNTGKNKTQKRRSKETEKRRNKVGKTPKNKIYFLQVIPNPTHYSNIFLANYPDIFI